MTYTGAFIDVGAFPLPGLGTLFFMANEGDRGQTVNPSSLLDHGRVGQLYREMDAKRQVEAIDAAEWDSPRAVEAIDKYGYIMDADFIDAMNWLLGEEPPWGKLQPREIPDRVWHEHGIRISPNVRAGLYMIKGMWEVEKKRRYEASNKALLDEYDGGADPASASGVY